MDYPKQIKALIDAYQYLPGIGKKTAERLALFTFSDMEEENIKRLSEAVLLLFATILKRCHNSLCIKLDMLKHLVTERARCA